MDHKQPDIPAALSLSDLSTRDRKLVKEALLASANAYAPYSGFAVGAAVRTKSGKIYAGANIENAAYAVVTCAEIAAISAAYAAGDTQIGAIAIAGHRFLPPPDSSQVVTPCGRCRQVINEACEVGGTEIQVFSCNGELSKIVSASITQLLPEAFGPKTLGIADSWPNMKTQLQKALKKLVAELRKS